MAEDLLTVDGDEGEGVPLIEQEVAGGRRVAPPRKLPDIAAFAAEQLKALPPYLRTRIYSGSDREKPGNIPLRNKSSDDGISN